MSAWYLFNCMGFYPVCPGSDEYALGSPCVPGMSLRLSDGGTLRVSTENWSRDNVYVKAVYLNSRRLTEPVIHYDDIRNGAELHFVMSRKPVKKCYK